MTTSIFNNRDIRSGDGGRTLLRIGLFGGGLFLVVLMLLSVVRVTRIGAGYVGVEVNLAGSQRGTQDIPVRTGWVFYSPLKTQVIEFPTFVQTVKWTADVYEGHPINEELVFNSMIHRNTKLSEAPSFGKPVILYDADSKGAINYLNLAKEILQKNNLTKIKQEDRIIE